MRVQFYKKLIVVLIFLISTSVYGQGILRGVVSDTVTRTPLFGANIYLRGTALGASTDREGSYKITGIPAGNYKIRVSYVGYKSKTFEINISNNDITLSVQLVPDVIQGAEVIITAQARGQVAAINQQLSANTIVNVVSEERIQELPDVNAAEAIGRLPGVSIQRSGGEANKIVMRGLSDKYSNITVNGIRIASTDSNSRGIDLSMISQGSLAGIELYKAITSDKDADAIAGSVNFVTKKAPSERLLRFDGKGAYNKLDNTLKQYDFTLRYGERFFNDILGVQFSGNFEQRDRSKENLNLDYNTNVNGLGTDWEMNDFTLNYTNETRKRNGASFLIDINTPDSGIIRINNIYNKTNRNYTTFERNYPALGSTDLVYTYDDRENEIKTFNSSIQGDNYIYGVTANWGFSFAQSNSSKPYDYNIDFREPSELANDGTVISGMKAVPPEILKGSPEVLIPYALNNFRKAYLNWGYFRNEKNLDKEKTAYLDITKKYLLSNWISGELKLGGKYNYKNRFKENSELASAYYVTPYSFYTMLPDGTVQRKNYSGTFFENLQVDNNAVLLINFLDPTPAQRNLYNKYSLYPLINRDALRQWWDINKNGVTQDGRTFEYQRNTEEDANYYDIIERVAAGYIMNTFKFGEDITFIAGLRIENENNDYKAKYSPGPLTGFPTPSGQILDTNATYSETLLLPNFHLTFRPTDFMNIRIATYKALARPDFNYRLQNAVARNASSSITLRVGNVNLKAANAWNYEINTSFFGNKIGLFTLSAFYKNISNMFHLVDGVRTSGRQLLDSLGIKWPTPFASGVLYQLTYPYNSSKPTYVWGFELEHQTNFTFLPGYLQNIVLNYNFSIVRSETWVATSKIVYDPLPYPPFQVPRLVLYESKQKLEGQPEIYGNIALGYDIGGFSARISFFYQGEYVRQFSVDGRNDRVQGSYTRLDFIVKQQITDKISMFLNVNNFTNYKEEDFLKNRSGLWNLLDTSQLYGLTADLGIRITF